MFEDFDYEDYFEPGVIDEIIIDAIAKAKEKIKEGIKINLEAELTKNQTEKERLERTRKTLADREHKVSTRERDVESKEKNMLTGRTGSLIGYLFVIVALKRLSLEVA